MGLFSSVGNTINNITGASSSAKQSYMYSAMLAAQNAKYQKEFAQNAHQWEIADLKAAGLNPILSAGGSGASASGGGGSAISAQNGAGGLASIINSATGLMRLSSEIDNMNSDTNLKSAMTEKVPSQIKNINSATAVNNAKANEIYSNIKVNTMKAANLKINSALQAEQKKAMRGGEISKRAGTWTNDFADYIASFF